MQGHIYKITNQLNGKVYIGQTLSKLNVRFNQHISYAKRSKETGRRLYYLSKALLKYGAENFKIDLVETVPVSELNVREIHWIGQFNSFVEGYNLNMGGHFRQKPEDRKYTQTVEHKQAISAAKKGRTLNWSEESLKAAKQAKVGSNNPNFGKKAARIVCEHCKKDVAKNIYSQYHGEKCKSLVSRV